jgi:hypothetical protein
MTRRKTAVPRRWAGRTTLSLVILLVCACGSSAYSSVAASSSTVSTASTCEHVSGVLADGPDPDADPVGFAAAHILLLRQISPTDQALRAALNQLADANQEFVASNGKSANAKEAVAVADKKVNSICPGAAS